MPLRSLKELRLDHNKLHTLNQDIFEHTTDIEILDLSNNPIVTIDQHTLAAIDSLANLKVIFLLYINLYSNLFRCLRRSFIFHSLAKLKRQLI